MYMVTQIKVRRPTKNYILNVSTIKADTGLDNTKEIRDAMLNQVM